MVPILYACTKCAYCEDCMTRLPFLDKGRIIGYLRIHLSKEDVTDLMLLALVIASIGLAIWLGKRRVRSAH